MARAPRDHRAIYARRKARAAAEGKTLAEATGHAKRAAGAAARKAERAKAAARKAAASKAAQARHRQRRRRPLGAGELTPTTSGRGLLAALDRAAARGHVVSISASFPTAVGFRGRTTDEPPDRPKPGDSPPPPMTLDEPPTDDCPICADRNKAGRVRDTGLRPAGPVHVTAGPRTQLARGARDPAELAAWLRAWYVNPWDGLAHHLGFHEGEGPG